jgi:hypothetical protein
MSVSRWMLIPFSWLPVLGCASDPTSQAVLSHLTPGLANVEWINAGPNGIEDQQLPPQDVVSNGLEACGRGAEHPFLRGQWPPCPKPAAPIAGRELLPTSDDEASARLVQPWQEVTVFDWPCTPAGRGGETGTGVICR